MARSGGRGGGASAREDGEGEDDDEEPEWERYRATMGPLQVTDVGVQESKRADFVLV